MLPLGILELILELEGPEDQGFSLAAQTMLQPWGVLYTECFAHGPK